MKIRRAILKNREGLIQLIECPKCNYFVKRDDIIWERKPHSIDDLGVVKYCCFCKGE